MSHIPQDPGEDPHGYRTLDLLSTLAAVLDERGLVVFANTALQVALGLSRRSLQDSPLAALFAGSDRTLKQYFTDGFRADGRLPQPQEYFVVA